MDDYCQVTDFPQTFCQVDGQSVSEQLGDEFQVCSRDRRRCGPIPTTDGFSCASCENIPIKRFCERPVHRVCCDSDGCCGLYPEACRNRFWPDFSHPRFLSCDQLYNRCPRENQSCGCYESEFRPSVDCD